MTCPEEPRQAEKPTARGAVKNALAIVTAQVSGNVLGAASTVLILAVLTRENYGILTSAAAFIAPIQALATLGLDQVALRRAAMEPKRVHIVVGTLTAIRVVLGLFAFIVACVVAYLFRSDNTGGSTAAMCAALAILPTSVGLPLQVVYQARQRMKRLIFLPALAAAIDIVAVLALWQLEAPIYSFIAIGALRETISATIVGHMVRGELGTKLHYDGQLARRMLRETIPLGYVNVVVILYHRIGIYLLENIHDVRDVADLGAAQKLVDPIGMISAALSVSVQPYVSRLAGEGGFAEFRSFFAKLLKFVVGILVPTAAVASLLVGPLVGWLKPEFIGAASAFRWLAFGMCWIFICQVTASCLIGLGRFRVIAYIASFNLLGFFAIGCWLVPTMAAEGAAIASFTMELINAIIQVTFLLLLLRRLDQGSTKRKGRGITNR